MGSPNCPWEKKMNKSDLSEKLAAKADLTKVRAKQYVDLVFDEIQSELQKGEKVTISDFGTFSISGRKPFQGHNPKTGESIAIPARNIPVFRAGRGFKEALNSGESNS